MSLHPSSCSWPGRCVAVSRLFAALLCAAIFGAAPAPAGAQALYGSLSGRIVDASGAPIADAAVTLVDIATQTAAAAGSQGDGRYQFSRVSPGTYTVSVGKDGFRQSVRSDVGVTINEQVQLDVVLEVGSVRETVVVAADSPLLQARSAEVSGLVDAARVRELPLNGENFQRLMLLAPGVAGGSPTNPAVSGSRPAANTYTLDGSSFSDERGANGGLAIGGGAADFGAGSPNLVSTEAIREFRVITSNADATFGRGSGAQVNVVTRSGSNAIDGSAYYYGRNDALDARDFFNSGPFFDGDGKAVTPPFSQHLFGISAGGPLARDRHFAFGSFEGFRQRLEQTASATVPNAALIAQIPGDLRLVYERFYQGQGIVPAVGNPAGSFSALPAATRAAALAAGFPREPFDGIADNGEAGTVLLSTANTRNVTQDSLLVRTDHRVTERLQASLRYAFAKPDLDSNTRAVTGSLIETRRRWQSAVGQVVWTLSPAQILEVRGGLLQSRRRDTPIQEIDPALRTLGVTSEYGLRSRVNGTALSLLEIPPGLGSRDNQTVPNMAVSHTWSRGPLTLRSGADVRHTDVDVLVVSNVAFYNFNGFIGPTGMLGSTAGQPQAVAGETVATLYGVPEGPTTPDRRWTSTEQEYFVQADMALPRNVTLNLGLRYSDYGVYRETTGAGANLYAVDDAARIVPGISPFTFGLTQNVMAPATAERPLYQRDRNNLQPRLGAAWAFGPGQRTVLRAAYGGYADRPFQGLWDFGVLNYPFATSLSVFNLPFQVTDLPIRDQPTQTRLLDPALESPYTHRFNATIERQLGAHFSVSAGYVGARADNLFRFYEPNAQAEVPQDRRPDPRFARARLLTNASTSQYDALQVTVRRRMHRGIDVTATYTYGQSLDDYSLDPSLSVAQMPSLVNTGASAAAGFQGGLAGQWLERPVSVDWGPSDFDARHAVVLSHLVELPFGSGRRWFSDAGPVLGALVSGWSLGGVLVVRSGEPFSLRLGPDVNDDGNVFSDRPALLTGRVEDLYADGSGTRVQYLIPKPDADQRLGNPTPVYDPTAAMARNTLRAPWFRQYDVSLRKAVQLGRGTQLALELNAFNVFNHVNLAAPIEVLSDARFGRVIRTRPGSNPRQLQFGAKLTF
jgi:hypothetical protein